MLLVINIGNTHTKLALYEGAEQRAKWRLASERERTADEWGALVGALLTGGGFGPPDVEAAIGSSVVPPITAALLEMCTRHLHTPLRVVGPGLDGAIRMAVEQPERVGTDRLVNAYAAYRRWGGPCLVVDLGTATTFNVVSPDGAFVGGAIAPGLGLAAEALAGRGAQLYAVPLDPPPTAIGRNTTEAMQAGLVLGYVALVEGLIGRMRAECAVLGWPPGPVIATGGLAATLARATAIFDYIEPDLTLDGLRLLHEAASSEQRAASSEQRVLSAEC
jgi:type III pantothenate kinase